MKRKRAAPPLPPVLTLPEETSLLKLLREQPVTTARVARLRRKLALREIKRAKGIPQFDIDQIISSVVFHLPKQNQRFAALNDGDDKSYSTTFNTSPSAVAAERREYVKPAASKDTQNQALGKDKEKDKEKGAEAAQKEPMKKKKRKEEFTYFTERLMGKPVQERISPYTCRVLLPFIRRDYESRPLRIQLYEELYEYHQEKRQQQEHERSRGGKRRSLRSRGDDINDEPLPTIAPIDYAYLRPSLVASVNRFLCELFWPDIDVEECLDYPDYTVVALYRLCVVGCALMTPEGYITYIAVHPEWRGASIGTFMMYHLLQTVPNKDITLHVSATNDEAVIMYQKLGFKPEQFIVDFYKQYYPDNSTVCLNAFFMRLRR